MIPEGLGLFQQEASQEFFGMRTFRHKNILGQGKEGSRIEGTLDFDSVNLGANF